MIYTLILKPRFRNTLRALAFVILVTFSAALYSCQTVYTENYTPEKLKTDDDVKILEVTSMNDSTINLSDYSVMHKENYKDSLSVLWYYTIDTSLIKTEPKKEYKITEKIAVINLKDVSRLKVEKSKFSFEKTLMYAGLTVLAIVVIGIIALVLFPPKFNINLKTF